MIRIVVDTNVIISALITKKTSPAVATTDVYNLLKSENILLVTSQALLEEIEDVVNREKIIKLHKLPKEKIQTILEEIIETSYIVPGKVRLAVIKNDPDDDRLLECAVEGNAEYIISGDPHLLKLKEYEGIKIVSPSEFVDTVKPVI